MSHPSECIIVRYNTNKNHSIHFVSNFINHPQEIEALRAEVAGLRAGGGGGRGHTGSLPRGGVLEPQVDNPWGRGGRALHGRLSGQ